MRRITAPVSPDEDLAFRILALDTGKAHNVRDRAMEVTRMARALAKHAPKTKEVDCAAQLESPELPTLGIAFEHESRFAAGTYVPFLRKADRFGTRTLPFALREPEGHASRRLAAAKNSTPGRCADGIWRSWRRWRATRTSDPHRTVRSCGDTNQRVCPR